jgi:hypothetical protein
VKEMERKEKTYKDIVFEKIDSKKLTIEKALKLWREIRIHSECNANNETILLSLSIEDLN